MNIQSQSRVGTNLSVVSVTASVSVTQTRTAVYAGFVVGSRLLAPHNPGFKGGFVGGFVAYSATTQVSIQASYRFSVPSQPRPKTSDPVRALFERTREHPAGAMLFGQTATYQVTTVSMLYFTYACRKASPVVAPSPKQMPAQMPRQLTAGKAPAAAAAPPFKAVPQAPNPPATAPLPATSAPAPERPGSTVSLKPFEPSKTSDPFDWLKLSNKEIGHRYDVWNALGREKPARVEVSLKASPRESKTVTPRKIDKAGLAFDAVDEKGNLEKISFSDVNRLRVLSA